MPSPNSRITLTEHCFRKLGAPVLEINVDPDQVEDCIDDAIQLYQEFHGDATKRIYISHQITSTDVTNKYIPIPSDVMTVVRLLPFSASSIGVGTGMFSIRYQLALDATNAGSIMTDLAYYSQLGQYLETLDMTLNGLPLVSFSRHEDKLYIDGEWWNQELKADDWVVMEVYSTINPNTSTSIYNDKFVKNYLTALIKQRWGQNMSKFDGIQLPGGVTISGKDMWAEATAELKELEERMRMEYEPMPDFMMG